MNQENVVISDSVHLLTRPYYQFRKAVVHMSLWQAQQRKVSQTADKSYLAAVRNMQILAGWSDPHMHNIPLFEYVPRGESQNRQRTTVNMSAHHSSNLEEGPPCPG